MGDCINGAGEGDREGGSGICEGVDGSVGVFSSTITAGCAFRSPRFDEGFSSLDFALERGFLLDGEGGIKSSSGAEVS